MRDGQVKVLSLFPRAPRRAWHSLLRVAVLLAAVGLGGRAWAEAAGEAWSFDRLTQIARDLAAKPYQPSPELPPKLAAWDFADYIKVWFKPEYEVWDRALQFRAAMFHRGFIHRDQVKLSVVRHGAATPVQFDPAMYYYGDLNPQLLDDVNGLGFAGFRLHYPLDGAESYNEVVAFLGASYFRAMGRGQVYGLSARGLGIDTGVGDEQFPAFRAAWLHEPKPGESTITVDLLLDGISVTGAYRMAITPGDTTAVEVKAELFARKDVRQLCVAPMTSMFWFGEGQKNAADFRPEVHDSDRLVVESADGSVLCRPLVNPPGAQRQRTRYAVQGLTRFGLVQRDRRFESYEDLDLRYDLRPSLWVEPAGDWGAGEVELFEFSTPGETVDNIGAYWVPAQPLKAGEQRSFGYRLLWTKDEGPKHTMAQVTETYHQPLPGGRVRTIVEFSGAVLNGMSQGNPPRAVLEGPSDDVVIWTRPNVARGGWRALFEWKPLTDTAAEPEPMRLWLSDDRGNTVSEIWTYPARL